MFIDVRILLPFSADALLFPDVKHIYTDIDNLVIINQTRSDHGLPELCPTSISKTVTGDEDSINLVDRILYDTTCLGGTFDHFHIGHKLLLTRACVHTKNKIIIGVSGDKLLKKKKYLEMMEPFKLRFDTVTQFVSQFNPHIPEHDIFELNDPGGPAIEDANIDAIICSSETLRGAVWVNNKRQEAGMPLLVIVEQGLVQNIEDLGEDDDGKISSSALRKLLYEEKQRNKL
eukprot:TRINITY_DN10997_c0_g1_i1.p1 TRINITY_DN10997_c0_g1~~TRINITY_DN10997_c0_g1_i1.p1  ORF type:complete len:231 (+),score=49.89 TRINITY_DN10997_c0_g1_i1:256-948(+)